tara:strand:+ start:7459 stop:7836 length:378 start_codon:yes stop_codon:yes gene_type:complete
MKVKFENPHGAITEEIEARFEAFVEKVNEKVAKHYAEKFPTLDPEHVVVSPNGRTYWKLIKEKKENPETGQRFVYGFVRKADGAIFKAAGWNAPFTKGPTAIRGYVTDAGNGLDAATIHGIVYAR